jgi:flagellar hook assembly protein FlgD
MVYPNPVADKGTVLWTVKTEGKVTLKLYDASGREIRRLVDAQMKPGRYTASWDGRAANGKKVAEGVYFYRLETAAGTCRQKVVVTK